MNTMLSSLTDLDVRVRNFVFERAVGMRFAFEMTEALDLGELKVGDLFEQNEDFWLFELNIDDVRRAGPGWVSPRRVEGSLDIALLTKAPRDKVKFSRQLEEVADWFQDDTITGIRFRSFIPTPAVPIRGFTAYNGVINLQFEINLAR